MRTAGRGTDRSGMETSELEINELGPLGDGIARTPKGVVFVEGALPGEKVRVEVFRDDKGIYRGRLENVVVASSHRQVPPCEHFDYCGNCTLQHLERSSYQEWKKNLAKSTLEKAGVQPQKWLPPLFIGEKSRRRATLTAFKHQGEVGIGYYRRRSSEVFDIDSCLVSVPEILQLREELKPVMRQILAEGETLDIFLQWVKGSLDLVLLGRIRHPDPEGLLRGAFGPLGEAKRVARVSWRSSEERTPMTIFSSHPLRVEFGLLQVTLPPAAFLQPTLEGERALIDAVQEALPEEGHFADLFAGCGTFSGPLLLTGSVEAYEESALAVKALTRAAEGLPLTVHQRDLFRNPLRPSELKRFDGVIFDPPRAGCPEQAAQLAGSRVPVLVGISCNPASFAKDAKILCDAGYKLKSVKIVDQFTWSHHVELVGVFSL